MNTKTVQYYKAIQEGNFEAAQDLKNSIIPLTLLKYYSFGDESCPDGNIKQCCESIALNNKKIETLENNKTFLASFDSLNDPFERRSIVPDYDKLSEFGYPKKVIEQVISNFYDSIIVTSLTVNFNSMPMWAHYSNNHNGICIEYEVTKPDKIYPVSYEPKRISATSIVANYIDLAIKNGKRGIDPFTDKDFVRYFYCMFNNINMKHEFWQYEQEYRLVYISTPDSCIDNETLGIKIKNIYLGLNCEPRCAAELKRISSAQEYGLYKMYFPIDKLDYELDYHVFT